MKKNLKVNLSGIKVLAPQTLTATAATDGVSTADCEAVTFVVQCGAMAFSGTDKLSLNVQHSDTDVGSTYVACTALDIFDPEDGANGTAKVLDGTEDQNTVHLVSYRGTKAFVRLNIVEGGTVSVPLSAMAIRGALKAQGTI